MKVLFVCSGNKKFFNIAPFIKDQAEDLQKNGVSIDIFALKGKGLIGYLGNIFRIRRFMKGKQYDIIHAHYVLSGLVCLISIPQTKKIVSFMGSDAYGDVNTNGKRKISSYLNILITYLIQPFFAKIIVKSNNIKRYIHLKSKCVVIPNGVNLQKIKLINYHSVRKELLFNFEKKYVLFLGDINNSRKNYQLAKKAINIINKDDIELINPYPIKHEYVIKFLNACDILLFTSYLEGSPNVIKEAMACNLPIVSTDVGDVKWIIDGIDGCYLTSFEPIDVAEKIKLAIDFSQKVGRTKGRERIIQLGLDSDTIAKKIIEVYKSVIEK